MRSSSRPARLPRTSRQSGSCEIHTAAGTASISAASSSARARASASLCRSAASVARRSVTSVATLIEAGLAAEVDAGAGDHEREGAPVLGPIGDLELGGRPPRCSGATIAARCSAVQMPSSTAFLPTTSSREKPVIFKNASLTFRYVPSARRVIAVGCGLR